MISLRDAFAGLYGAYRLALLDEGGMSFLDKSLAGFWRSFYAALLVAPLFAILLSIRYGGYDLPPPPFRYLALNAIAYVTAWFVFPLIMLRVADALDRSKQYFGFIVAYNWASVWQNLVYIPFAVLVGVGAIGGGFGALVGMLIVIAVMAYTWFIAKTALEIGGGMAAGIVVMDWSLSVFLNGITQYLMHKG